METNHIKKSLHDLIDQIEDAELLAAVYKIMLSGRKKYKEFTQEEVSAVKEGLDDLKNKNVYSQDEVIKEIRELIKRKETDKDKYPLRNTVLKFDDPVDPVSEDDWEALG